jgi:hypothetical protein
MAAPSKPSAPDAQGPRRIGRGTCEPSPPSRGAAGLSPGTRRPNETPRRHSTRLARHARSPCARGAPPKDAHRADRGLPRSMPAGEIERWCEIAAAMNVRTINKNGRHLSTVRTLKMLVEHGVDMPDGFRKLAPCRLTASTINRHLRRLGYDHARMTRQPPLPLGDLQPHPVQQGHQPLAVHLSLEMARRDEPPKLRTKAAHDPVPPPQSVPPPPSPADSDDAAQSFRHDGARRSGLMPPT